MIPEHFLIPVRCDDGTAATVVVPGAGGPGSPTVTATVGALCSLEEFGSAQLPAGWIVSLSVNGGPPSSELPAVEVLQGQTVTITVINDAAGVSAENVTRNGETGAVTAQPRFTG